MRFEEENRVVYCKDEYNKEFDNDSFFYKYCKEYYKGYLIHRVDGAAVKTDIKNTWYNNGVVHREDGPAIELFDGSKFWYKEGTFHREGGPAIEWSDKTSAWYLNGERYTKEEYKDIMNIKKKRDILN